jgi:predicted transcriptional regulator
MATMTVRTTFALDVATENSIQRLAKLWKTSKAEVVRRSVAQAESAVSEQSRPSPLDALKWLQENGKLTEDEAQKWSRDSKRGWDEGWKRKELAAKPAAATKNRKGRVS